MRLSDAYRLLDLPPGASDEEVKRAWRDLTKVWHPDRFAHDDALRRKAQEKLKEINQAYETITAAGGAGGRGRREWAGGGERGKSSRGGGDWRLRNGGRETAGLTLDRIVELAERGSIGEDAEIFHPSNGRWMRLRDLPEVRLALARIRIRRYLTWVITCASIALILLFRRPTPTGLAISAVLFSVSFYLISRMRRVAEELRGRRRG
jgi:curved DNA-binding protein CbpA